MNIFRASIRLIAETTSYPSLDKSWPVISTIVFSSSTKSIRSLPPGIVFCATPTEIFNTGFIGKTETFYARSFSAVAINVPIGSLFGHLFSAAQ